MSPTWRDFVPSLMTSLHLAHIYIYNAEIESRHVVVQTWTASVGREAAAAAGVRAGRMRHWSYMWVGMGWAWLQFDCYESRLIVGS